MQVLLTLLCFLLVPGLWPRESPQQDATQRETPYVERDERDFSFYPGGKLEVVTGVAGNLKIIGWQRASIRLEAEKIVYHLPREQAKVLMDQYPIQVRWNQTSAKVHTVGSPQTAATLEINITLYVPKDRTDINARVMQGDLAIGAINGWVEATLKEGNLEAKSMSGYFSATTQRGDIRVEMSGNRWSGMEFDAVTQRGSVELLLPADYSAALQLGTHDGNISIQYPQQMVDGEPVPPQVVIRQHAQSLKAAVGEGGAPIKLLTMSGDVKLSVKP